ncbi:aminotransferase class I/II-fold pyridoxal phosphate-dependent enzyme [Candidatus Poribacteria bacterium]|nr:aminotransferase class I/II-fold pyridoxal phosphate-dependent enzyme [Candidatus Poribacteria bacterium]
MNALALELNKTIQTNNQHIYDMLSDFGKKIYFPKGILSQGAEAKQKAKKTNATIGIAVENGEPMHLTSIRNIIDHIPPKDSFNYAPASGKPELRSAWRDKILSDNPSLRDKALSNPVVTNGLTHGLSLTADLFVNPGDAIILPDKMWGNYRLMLSVRYGGQIKTYPFYSNSGGFNIEAFRETVIASASENNKLIILLNFPNNPTGYTLTPDEAKGIASVIKDAAQTDCNIVAISDDAYFGLFYDDETLKESLSGYIAGTHPRILTVKICGATKEEYVWGFRVGFLTYCLNQSKGAEDIFYALERKTMGAIRSSISNCSHISQTLVLRALQSETLGEERKQKAEVMASRAQKVKEVIKNNKYNDAWDVYPFNSGYFMCLKLKSVDAEELRTHLLDKYGIGVIALGGSDLRIAFSCVEVEDIQDLFDTIYKGIKDLSA